jgi:hypothetical protein
MVDSTISLKLDATFDASLQCPICLEYFSIPIFQCDSGHSICNRCAQRIPKCPTCRANIGRKLRNYHLEQQLSSIDYKCRHPGCNEVIKLAYRANHEESCTYNPNLTCIMQSCKWTGHKSALLSHLKNKHKIPHYDIVGSVAEYSSRLRSTSLSSTAGCVKLLHTFFLPSGEVVTVLTYIFMDSMKNLFYPQFRTFGEKPVRYNLCIWNTESDEEDELVISGKAQTLKYSLEEEREMKRCMVLDLESLINMFAFQDKIEEGHKLLHYKLTISDEN